MRRSPADGRSQRRSGRSIRPTSPDRETGIKDGRLTPSRVPCARASAGTAITSIRPFLRSHDQDARWSIACAAYGPFHHDRASRCSACARPPRACRFLHISARACRGRRKLLFLDRGRDAGRCWQGRGVGTGGAYLVEGRSRIAARVTRRATRRSKARRRQIRLIRAASPIGWTAPALNASSPAGSAMDGGAELHAPISAPDSDPVHGLAAGLMAPVVENLSTVPRHRRQGDEAAYGRLDARPATAGRDRRSLLLPTSCRLRRPSPGRAWSMPARARSATAKPAVRSSSTRSTSRLLRRCASRHRITLSASSVRASIRSRRVTAPQCHHLRRRLHRHSDDLARRISTRTVHAGRPVDGGVSRHGLACRSKAAWPNRKPSERKERHDDRAQCEWRDLPVVDAEGDLRRCSYVLRNDLALNAAKFGWGVRASAAPCTVLLDGKSRSSPAWCESRSRCWPIAGSRRSRVSAASRTRRGGLAQGGSRAAPFHRGAGGASGAYGIPAGA